MLLLTSTSDKLQVVSGQAVTTDVHASWIDYNAGTVTPGRTNSAISTATTTDVVASPGASTQRNVKTLVMRNKHASSSVDVTVRHTDGTTIVELIKVTLLAGETLSYMDDEWLHLDSNGVPKQVGAPLSVKTLSADQSNSTVTPTVVGGLTVSALVGTYIFWYMLVYQAAATTTGVRFSVNHTGTVSLFVANWHVVDNTAAAATAAADQDAIAATAQVYSAFAARAKSTAGWGTTISVDTANADMLAVVEGLTVVTVDGNLELYHGSEVAAASTIKAGSSLTLFKTG